MDWVCRNTTDLGHWPVERVVVVHLWDRIQVKCTVTLKKILAVLFREKAALTLKRRVRFASLVRLS